MTGNLVFGWRTAILLVAVVELLLLSAALLRPLQNRVANRTLASLLVVLAGIVTPWMIGFAGFYDRWHWLSFAPFAISLGVAPLAFLYVAALIDGKWPSRGWRHLMPAAIQFLYLASAFIVLREPAKDDWLDRSALAYDVITGLAVAVGLAVYGVRSRRMLVRYRARLERSQSDDHRYGLNGIDRIAAALFVLLAIWATYDLWDIIAPLGYRRLMGLYVAIAIFAVFLGIEGWRLSAVTFPRLSEPGLVAPTTGWATRGRLWLEQIERDRLFTDPSLSVPRLARLLATNSSYVSRALNDGLGESFSSMINRLRSEDVARRLSAGEQGDLLDIALDCGFSSKATFNRAFRARYGCSPSAYRLRNGSTSQNLRLDAI
ncbi:helix-turn-helix domain-containing protein [Sphingomonas sp. GlSt437]|uniref:helix-turn-helix domain-containing protein n=1 Tax=Sphingomonas sp. GlSt437 TaxID=3389970 RepID=UPI003A87CC44